MHFETKKVAGLFYMTDNEQYMSKNEISDGF